MLNKRQFNLFRHVARVHQCNTYPTHR